MTLPLDGLIALGHKDVPIVQDRLLGKDKGILAGLDLDRHLPEGSRTELPFRILDDDFNPEFFGHGVRRGVHDGHGARVFFARRATARDARRLPF